MNMDEYQAVLLAKYHEKLRALDWAEGWSHGRAEGKAEGQAEALRETVFQLGRQRFGKAPNRKQQTQLKAITDVARLLDATSWNDLLSTP